MSENLRAMAIADATADTPELRAALRRGDTDFAFQCSYKLDASGRLVAVLLGVSPLFCVLPTDMRETIMEGVAIVLARLNKQLDDEPAGPTQ